MSDQVSRNEDLERTDVLPQLGFEPDDDDASNTAMLAQPSATRVANSQPVQRHAVAPFGAAAQTSSGNGQLHTLPVKPSPTDLAVGGIRGKIADLEGKLIEAQDHQADLNRHCEQLTQRCRASEERVVKAEANYVQQSSDLFRVGQRAADAEQRLVEQRVRFEAQIVDAERQLVDARVRADKRAIALEQLLTEQTERTTQSERTAADARLEFERLRAELSTAQAAVQGLEARVAEQTRTASDISRLYAQQTGQVASFSTAIADSENKIASLQAAKAESEQQVLALQEQARLAAEAAVKLQSEIAMKLRHIAAIEHGLEHRDQFIVELKTKYADRERDNHDLNTAKAELDERCAALQKTLTDAQAAIAGHQNEVSRLTFVVQMSEQRIGELNTAQSAAEQLVRDRDAAIAEATTRAQVAQQNYEQVSEQVNNLHTRLDSQEQTINALQAQLQTRSGELQAAHDSLRVFQQKQTELDADKEVRTSEFDILRKTTQKVTTERDQLELENQAGRAELSRTLARCEEAVQTIIAARESISVREQRNASLERELNATTVRLEETHARLERAAAATETFDAELRARDSRIAALEQQLMEHVSALSAIGQDIERVNASSPNERLAAMGYALESLDHPGVIHRITRMTTTAGRNDSNDIEIDSTSVSRYHARIVVKPEGVWLIDLQSTNGCGVNGRRTSRQILCDGDAVMIGHCRFRFSMLGAGANKNARLDDLQLSNGENQTDHSGVSVLPGNNGSENRMQHH
jgi:chromosome segregation ATPase